MQLAIRLDQLAELIGVSYWTAHRMLLRKQIKGFKAGREWRIPISELVKLGISKQDIREALRSMDKGS